MAKRKTKRRTRKPKEKKIWLEMMIIILILLIVAIAYHMWNETETRYYFQENCEVVQVPYIEKTCNATGCFSYTVEVEEVVCDRSVGNETVYKYR